MRFLSPTVLAMSLTSPQWSFGYRDHDGAFMHRSRRRLGGGLPFSRGDTVGCFLFQAPGELGSVLFFKNGLPSGGVAFAQVPNGVYYPAVSMFGGGSVRVNFGPHMALPPAPDALPCPSWMPASALENRLARGRKSSRPEQPSVPGVAQPPLPPPPPATPH